MRIVKQVRGTQIIIGDDLKQRSNTLLELLRLAAQDGFKPIGLPSIEPAEIYTDKAGPEILNQMYVFKDKKGRDLCLRPEVTATIQLIADEHYKNQKDVKLYYFERCWRYERPQTGRLREFYQFGCEWINPRDIDLAKADLIRLASEMVELKTKDYDVNTSVKRGLSYYTDLGFEIIVDSLGAQKQVVGGGAYKQGIGFALGFERLMLCQK